VIAMLPAVAAKSSDWFYQEKKRFSGGIEECKVNSCVGKDKKKSLIFTRKMAFLKEKLGKK
jgi:hypothetical protein